MIFIKVCEKKINFPIFRLVGGQDSPRVAARHSSNLPMLFGVRGACSRFEWRGLPRRIQNHPVTLHPVAASRHKPVWRLGTASPSSNSQSTLFRMVQSRPWARLPATCTRRSHLPCFASSGDEPALIIEESPHLCPMVLDWMRADTSIKNPKSKIQNPHIEH